jgi:hypothetical protein
MSKKIMQLSLSKLTDLTNICLFFNGAALQYKNRIYISLCCRTDDFDEDAN